MSKAFLERAGIKVIETNGRISFLKLTDIRESVYVSYTGATSLFRLVEHTVKRIQTYILQANLRSITLESASSLPRIELEIECSLQGCEIYPFERAVLVATDEKGNTFLLRPTSSSSAVAVALELNWLLPQPVRLQVVGRLPLTSYFAFMDFEIAALEELNLTLADGSAIKL